MREEQYKQYYAVKPKPTRCLTCSDHVSTPVGWGHCQTADMPAYYAQLDGFCPIVVEELKKATATKRQ